MVIVQLSHPSLKSLRRLGKTHRPSKQFKLATHTAWANPPSRHTSPKNGTMRPVKRHEVDLGWDFEGNLPHIFSFYQSLLSEPIRFRDELLELSKLAAAT